MSTLWVMELSRQLCGKMRRSGRKGHLSSPPASTFGLEIHFYTPNVHQLEYLSGCYTAEELCVKAAKKCCKWQACWLLKDLCARCYDTLKPNNQVWRGLLCGIVNDTPKILAVIWLSCHIEKVNRHEREAHVHTINQRKTEAETATHAKAAGHQFCAILLAKCCHLSCQRVRQSTLEKSITFRNILAAVKHCFTVNRFQPVGAEVN